MDTSWVNYFLWHNELSLVHYIQPRFEVLRQLSNVFSCNDKRIQQTSPPFSETSIVTSLSWQVASKYKAVSVLLVIRKEHHVNKANHSIHQWRPRKQQVKQLASQLVSLLWLKQLSDIMFYLHLIADVYMYLTVKIYTVLHYIV